MYESIEKEFQKREPNMEWVVSLFTEIRHHLCRIISKESPVRKDIEEKLDSELLLQLLKNDAFSVKDLQNLIQYLFHLGKSLGSPFFMLKKMIHIEVVRKLLIEQKLVFQIDY